MSRTPLREIVQQKSQTPTQGERKDAEVRKAGYRAAHHHIRAHAPRLQIQLRLSIENATAQHTLHATPAALLRRDASQGPRPQHVSLRLDSQTEQRQPLTDQLSQLYPSSPVAVDRGVGTEDISRGVVAKFLLRTKANAPMGEPGTGTPRLVA